LSLPGEPRWTLHCVITKCAEYSDIVSVRHNPETGKLENYVPQLGNDIELPQLCTEFPMRLVTERQLDQALAAMCVRLKEQARKHGMLVDI
jgi:hypothetical protein